MTVRPALTVIVAVAIVAAAAPTIQEARRSIAAEAGERAGERIRTAVASLLQRSDAVAPDVRGARRRVAVDVPEPGYGTAGLAYVAVGISPSGSVPDGPASDVVGYRVRGGTTHSVRLPVDVRVAGHPDADGNALVVRESTRLVLRLVRRDGRRVVVAREFKSRGATTAPRASSTRPTQGRRR